MKIAVIAIIALALIVLVCGLWSCASHGQRLKVGETFTYTAKIHPSVGYSFHAEYDNKEAFSENYSVKYDDSKAVSSGLCGADSGQQTITLKALQKGNHTIKIIHEFRGKVEKELTFKLSVR